MKIQNYAFCNFQARQHYWKIIYPPFFISGTFFFFFIVSMDDPDETFSVDYLPQSPSFSSPPHDYDTFHPVVSGFGESDVNSIEGSEVDESRIDDAQLENTAVQIYQDRHPGREQRAVGGREIGEDEAIWRVSSLRPDWGPDKLRDNNPLTYWQSDCSNPRKHHTIDLIFHQATLIRQISLFIDFFQDESYTPKDIAIRCGTTRRDLYVRKIVYVWEVVSK